MPDMIKKRKRFRLENISNIRRNSDITVEGEAVLKFTFQPKAVKHKGNRGTFWLRNKNLKSFPSDAQLHRDMQLRDMMSQMLLESAIFKVNHAVYEVRYLENTREAQTGQAVLLLPLSSRCSLKKLPFLC